MIKEIPVIYTLASFEHKPPFEVFNGKRDVASENVQRIRRILSALKRTDFANISVTRLKSLPWVKGVHDSDYLDFLKRASGQAAKEGKPLYPSAHPYHPDFRRATNPVSERGLYVFDTYTPIMGNTREVALESAACAVAGAKMLVDGEPVVYALTRPPGHHAEKAAAGGYCYINNVAVAAEFLRRNGAKRIAIFDFDFHHGNGTQDIFYERPDILVVNIHSAPKDKFPYFTGYPNEFGNGEGEGANYNFPLPLKTGDAEYHAVVKKSLKIISDYKPDYLLVSAGFDTHKKDPIGGFSLTTTYYRQLGRVVRALGIPTLSVQEGGYATAVLGENVVSYLRGLID